MSRKTEKLFDAITLVREDLIEEAQTYRFERKVIPWGRYAALAASLLLVFSLGYSFLLFGGGKGGGSKNDCAAPPNTSDGADWNAAPSAPAAPEAPEAAELVAFTGTVLEVHEGYLLVEPAEGESVRLSADRIEVPTGDLTDLPALTAGDRVEITFAGTIQETYPARVTGVRSVEKLAE